MINLTRRASSRVVPVALTFRPKPLTTQSSRSKLPFVPLQGQGRVEQPITAEGPGRAYFQATTWPAELADGQQAPLAAGDRVAVLGRRGLTLVVRAL